MGRETFKFWDLLRLILETLRYIPKRMHTVDVLLHFILILYPRIIPIFFSVTPLVLRNRMHHIKPRERMILPLQNIAHEYRGYILWNILYSPSLKPLSHQGGVLTATARRARKTQNAELRAVRSPRAPRDRRGIAVASPLDAVGSPRTPCHGAHFVHAQSARRGSAFPRRSEWAPCERRGFAAATQ